MSERVLICGSRGFSAPEEISGAVASLPAHTIVITGEAPGPDQWAARMAEARGLHVARVRFGKRAGPARNRAMLDLEPHRVFAFWDGKSAGTKDTIEEAERRGIPVWITEMGP